MIIDKLMLCNIDRLKRNSSESDFVIDGSNKESRGIVLSFIFNKTSNEAEDLTLLFLITLYLLTR